MLKQTRENEVDKHGSRPKKLKKNQVAMKDNSKVLFSSFLLFADLSPCSQTLSVLDESTRVQSHCTYSIFPVCTFSPPRISPDEGRGDRRTGQLSLNSIKSVLAPRHLEVSDKWSWCRCKVPAHHKCIWDIQDRYSKPREYMQEHSPRFSQLYFTKAQTVANSKQRNLTRGVVESDTRKQPKMEMRKVSITYC